MIQADRAGGLFRYIYVYVGVDEDVSVRLLADLQHFTHITRCSLSVLRWLDRWYVRILLDLVEVCKSRQSVMEG